MAVAEEIKKACEYNGSIAYVDSNFNIPDALSDVNQSKNEIIPISLDGTQLGNMCTKVVESAYKSSEEKTFVKIVLF